MGNFTMNLFGFRKTKDNPMDKMKEIPTPKITERDLTHCNCCSPPRRTLVTGLDTLGMPKFLCTRSGISYTYAHCRGEGSTYIAGTGALV